MADRLAPLAAFRLPRNIVLDARTVAAMVRIFCRDVHGRPAGHLCDACTALLGYAEQRLARCPFGPEKTTCRECPIHCYRPAQRSVMKDVMRHAGPRMLWRHPWLAVRHLWLDRKGPPPWPPYASRQRAAQGSLIRTSSSPLAVSQAGFFPSAGEYSRGETPLRLSEQGIGSGRPDGAGQGNCSSRGSYHGDGSTSPAS